MWHRPEIVSSHRKDLSASGNYLSFGQTRVANFVCVCMWGVYTRVLKITLIRKRLGLGLLAVRGSAGLQSQGGEWP